MTIRKHTPNPAIVRSTEAMAAHLATKNAADIGLVEIITDRAVIEESLADTVANFEAETIREAAEAAETVAPLDESLLDDEAAAEEAESVETEEAEKAEPEEDGDDKGEDE